MVSSLMNQSSPAESDADILLTVIVPVFNTRTELIDRAVVSALNQTHSYLELIVVNDGSTPEVAGFLDQVAERDSRIVVIHQRNGGVSAARNKGLERATGSFVAYLDADDYLEPEFLSAALAVALSTKADAVFGGMRVLHGSSSVEWRTGGPSAEDPLLAGQKTIVAACVRALSDSPSPKQPTQLLSVTNVVSCIYRAEAARRHRFPEGVSHAEDRLHNVHFLLAAETVAFCSDVWYVYDASHEQGATRSATTQTITALSRTVREFAEVRGLAGSRQLPDDAQKQIVQAAADGVLNYLKLLSGVMAVVGRRATNQVLLCQLLSEPSVLAAAARTNQPGLQNLIFGAAVRRRQGNVLLLLGWLWVRMGRLEMSVEQPRRVSGRKPKNG
ncbi:glycosyltransferase involved in cell wall biosynthesis [Pseudarthrobacter sp. W1I19]|uniref:glycosyltransferase family 2 protein n=1 Tax=Pseudarthrobacter sp. W1I19 TaxID=3042288 RepID=UPI002787EE3E|nr:glycosyltransferase family 2 protein [Pseudarthrobacter sp. W1I19]MDQ0922309.1 glycosyltransferase involved in cell wall biosynthesis [Pseudarthrobacter sp. W1I19]